MQARSAVGVLLGCYSTFASRPSFLISRNPLYSGRRVFFAPDRCDRAQNGQARSCRRIVTIGLCKLGRVVLTHHVARPPLLRDDAVLFRAVVREVLNADAKRHLHAPGIAIIVLRVHLRKRVR